MAHLYPGNPALYPANVRLVDDGDPGDAATLNAPWAELADRTAHLNAGLQDLNALVKQIPYAVRRVQEYALTPDPNNSNLWSRIIWTPTSNSWTRGSGVNQAWTIGSLPPAGLYLPNDIIDLEANMGYWWTQSAGPGSYEGEIALAVQEGAGPDVVYEDDSVNFGNFAPPAEAFRGAKATGTVSCKMKPGYPTSAFGAHDLTFYHSLNPSKLYLNRYSVTLDNSPIDVDVIAVDVGSSYNTAVTSAPVVSDSRVATLSSSPFSGGLDPDPGQYPLAPLTLRARFVATEAANSINIAPVARSLPAPTSPGPNLRLGGQMALRISIYRPVV